MTNEEAMISEEAMTNEEAIKWLDEHTLGRLGKGGLEAKIKIVKALNKQIPKKPIVIQKGKVEEGGCYGVFYCPSCYELEGHKDWKCLVKYDQSYCECCGQELDWSEE